MQINAQEAAGEANFVAQIKKCRSFDRLVSAKELLAIYDDSKSLKEDPIEDDHESADDALGLA